MNLKRIISSLMFVIIAIFAYSQTDIDYNHKTLVKVLHKAEIQDLKTLKEVVISNSTSSILPNDGKYFEIETENTSNYKYIYVGRVNSCRAGGCSISNYLSQDLSSEYFDYFMLFDKSLRVQYVKVFNYQATHGQEITAKGWLKQFVGFDGSKKLTVGKNIDAVSGATISVNAITDDISCKTKILKELL